MCGLGFALGSCLVAGLCIVSGYCGGWRSGLGMPTPLRVDIAFCGCLSLFSFSLGSCLYVVSGFCSGWRSCLEMLGGRFEWCSGMSWWCFGVRHSLICLGWKRTLWLFYYFTVLGIDLVVCLWRFLPFLLESSC
ncbi:hypothetical protein SUGI_0076120 [Cryptomeria japonica]|nr:hypothetical protein SUGI_0076120 [Cryptomeria japonica]